MVVQHDTTNVGDEDLASASPHVTTAHVTAHVASRAIETTSLETHIVPATIIVEVASLVVEAVEIASLSTLTAKVARR